jgi:hypothetical protein
MLNLFPKNWHLPKCKVCKHTFSDWFVWSNGLRHCFYCWQASGHEFTILEDGNKIDCNGLIKK